MKKHKSYALQKGRFPGNRVFLGDLYFLENGAWRAFGASVLNKFEFLTMYHLYTITHQCQHTRLKCYTGEFVYGIICIRERFRNSIYPKIGEKAYFICPAKGKISREEGFLGGQCISKKTGLGELLGQVS